MTIEEDTAATLLPATIKIRPLSSQEDAIAFRELNEEWITRHFSLEPADRRALGDPWGTILNKGGQIFMVEYAGATVGCVALIPGEHGAYELSKMAVTPSMRGLGIGRRLLEHAVAEARKIGARSLWLGSNTLLSNAVHLYESVGFRHMPAAQHPVGVYVRANVFMDMLL